MRFRWQAPQRMRVITPVLFRRFATWNEEVYPLNEKYLPAGAHGGAFRQRQKGPSKPRRQSPALRESRRLGPISLDNLTLLSLFYVAPACGREATEYEFTGPAKFAPGSENSRNLGPALRAVLDTKFGPAHDRPRSGWGLA
jgi:hypothetical protein